MELEFISRLCICEHEYLKLVIVILFEKISDHNLNYDHDSFVCQELINSGILMINLAVLKLFIDDRNSFSIEKRKKLRLYQSANHTLNKEGLVMTQNNEVVKTDLLLMINASPPKISSSESQSTSNTVTTLPSRKNFC